jgi:hypothetical protein
MSERQFRARVSSGIQNDTGALRLLQRLEAARRE